MNGAGARGDRHWLTDSVFASNFSMRSLVQARQRAQQRALQRSATCLVLVTAQHHFVALSRVSAAHKVRRASACRA